MFYYLVWVRSEQYRGVEPLTYSSTTSLAAGQIVKVPLRSSTVLGFVAAETAKPKFTTKAISDILNLPPLPQASLRLALWLQSYYPSPVGVITQQFLPISLGDELPLTPSAEAIPSTALGDLPPLTSEQQSALAAIEVPDSYLLHGRTGSGKTRIYIELTARSIATGRSAIILSPEIGLSSQLAVNFRSAFGMERVVILHSQLTPKARRSAWVKILTSKAPIIVIGPRSAIFSPLRDIGLIVVDESHDQGYKQEQPPYYHAVRVASQLRAIQKAVLVLGSATPSVADYYLAVEKQKPIIRLEKLATGIKQDSRLVVVNLRDKAQFSRSSMLSDPLIASIQSGLEKSQQSLLYLNRRGTARVTLCEQCGWQALCPNCDLPLIYHADTFSLRCHICGYRQKPPTSCPVCGNVEIRLRNFGTKAVVDEAQRLFPEARLLRLDTDTPADQRLERQFEAIHRGEVDIVVGTQLVTKGLDLPKLRTLGVILADSSLYLPDYTAQERTFQLLTQVLGRVGRGHTESEVIVQTYHPSSELLTAAIENDWAKFYVAELHERHTYRFPPFCFLLKLTISRASSKGAERSAETLKDKLSQEEGLTIHIDGPTPSFREKSGKKYKWQLVIRAQNRLQLIKVIGLLPAGWSYDIDPADLL